MSDERKPTPSDPAYTSIPPELVPYMGLDPRPPVQRRGEDPELDAAFDALEAIKREPEERPAQQIDPTRGVGNVSAYVGPVEIRQRAPGGAAAPEGAKVALAMTDVPRRLPAGNPAHQTVETRVVNLRPRTAEVDAAEDDVTRDDVTVATPESRSRWANGAAKGAIGVNRHELPSALGPASERGLEAVRREPESERVPARVPTWSRAGIAAVALVGVAALLGVRKMTSAPQDPLVASTSTQSAVAATAPPRAGPTQEPSVPKVDASAAPAASVSTALVAPGAVTGSASAPVAPAVAPGRLRPHGVLEDPYDAAPPAPRAAPSATLAPTAPLAAPSATSTGTRWF